jgi:hypothetical protein
MIKVTRYACHYWASRPRHRRNRIRRVPDFIGGSDTDPSGPQTMQRRKQMTLKQRTLAAFSTLMRMLNAA